MKIRYTVELDDVVAWHQFYLDTNSVIRKRRQYLTILIGLSSLAVGGLALLSWQRGNSSAFLVCLAIFGFYFVVRYWFASRKVNPKQVAKFYSQQHDKGILCQHELEVTSDGLVERTAVAEHRILFQGIDRIESTPTHSFVFVGTSSAHIIPHSKVKEGHVGTFLTALKQSWEGRAGGKDDGRSRNS